MAAPADFDRCRSLTELEAHDWGPPGFSSYVVTTAHEARQIPVAELSLEQLRLLVGQAIGLPFLVHPLLELLERDPWACGDFQDGDILAAAVRPCNHPFWLANPASRLRLLGVMARMEQDEDEDRTQYLNQTIRPDAEPLTRAS